MGRESTQRASSLLHFRISCQRQNNVRQYLFYKQEDRNVTASGADTMWNCAYVLCEAASAILLLFTFAHTHRLVSIVYDGRSLRTSSLLLLQRCLYKLFSQWRRDKKKYTQQTKIVVHCSNIICAQIHCQSFSSFSKDTLAQAI